MNELDGEVAVYLVAQVIHVYVNDVCECIESFVPHFFCEHCARQHLIGMAHEAFEQSEFFRGELNRKACARNPASERVEQEVAYLQSQVNFIAVAAAKRANASEQFGECERLCKVIIRAVIESTDFH